MNNKVLIKLDAFALGQSYDVFIPVNEKIWKVKAMLAKCVCDLEHLPFDPSIEYILMNKIDGTIYDSNVTILESNIRNGSELLIMSRI